MWSSNCLADHKCALKVNVNFTPRNLSIDLNYIIVKIAECY